MRTIHRTIAAGLIAAAAFATVALPAHAHDAGEPHEPAVSSAAQNKLIAEVRAGTARFHDVDVAIAAGYVPVGECVEGPEGAMGHHYMNPALIQPGAPVDPANPPMLTYGPSPSGGLKLWSAEFFEPDVGQPTPMFGSQPFDGPMPGHEPGMPVHYDLHVWIGAHNPGGIFTPFNSALHC